MVSHRITRPSKACTSLIKDQSPLNIIALLHSDHEKIRSLFEKFEQTRKKKKPQDRQVLAEQIFRELAIHAKLEEEIFYPALRVKGGNEDKMLVSDSIKDHQQINLRIQEIRANGPDDETYDKKFRDLIELVNTHIQVEEDDLFPDAELFFGNHLENLGKEAEALKGEILAVGDETAQTAV